MIRVHHLNRSRSLRILWLLEEIGQPYEVIRYERDAKPASRRRRSKSCTPWASRRCWKSTGNSWPKAARSPKRSAPASRRK